MVLSRADLDLQGVLFFPLTAFDEDGRINVAALTEHIDSGVKHECGAVFAACGTGEYHALDSAEYRSVVQTAVDTVARRVPVVAGVGGPVAVAVRQAAEASALGVDGLLVLPPYLVRATQDGLLSYLEQVAAAADVPVVVYSRDNAALTVESATRICQIPGVVGLKDGVGDIDRMSQIVVAVRSALRPSGKQFTFFNGLGTAEVSARAYAAVGAGLYSSAVFAFAPEIATAFHRALMDDDGARADELLERFFVPFARLRDSTPGYQVALVKAGAELRGVPMGAPRAPLARPAPEHLDRLRELIDVGLHLADPAR